MAHARHAERPFPSGFGLPLVTIAAGIAAVIVALIVSIAAFDLRLGPSGVQAPPDRYVLAGEAHWEVQRKLQSGDLDPLMKAQREWERQRIQLGLAFD